MCGITGILEKQGSKVEESVIKQMTDIISHRGPDDEGIWCKDNIGLGHRRLSIIDLSQTGHQPMFSDDGRYVIVFNGEIYNFPELKEELIKKDYKFHSTSDTEVILALFKEKKYDLPKYLNGIFAFAIWDKKEKELFLARDHFGVKPLYYYYQKGRFIFASEIKSILQIKGINKELNKNALDILLTFRHTPSPLTLFKNINKLEPAHSIIIKSNISIKKECYWNYIPVIENKKENYYKEKLQHLYFSATKRQMISDAPIGLSLSSGVDSGALLAIMSEISDEPIKAFTVDFEEGYKTNEVYEAKKTAEMFGAEFYSYIIKASDYIDFFENYIWHLEEPIGNESAAAYYFVAKEARKHVKVLLNGQGIDETMAGYGRHIGIKYSKQYQKIPAFIRNNFLKPLIFNLNKNEQLKRAVISLDYNDLSERFLKTYTIVHENQKKQLYNSEYHNFVCDVNYKGHFEKFRQKVNDLSLLEQMLYIDTRTSLTDNLLLCEDKMSMATSIEARVPFLDVPLVEFIESIPGKYKLKLLTGKYIHKKTVEKWLPKEKIYMKKRGFDNPMEKWLKAGLKHFLLELINDNNSISNQYFNIDYLNKLYNKHETGKEDYTRFLFLLLSVEMWNRKFILNA
ncbi:MAG: asparagine synthase (glutamine-hydrolyzing) [Bacteroidales bacterium]|nr:asparagine synthase (glutamine-hydrolyzing) [Bacteroidales bacterium]